MIQFINFITISLFFVLYLRHFRGVHDLAFETNSHVLKHINKQISIQERQKQAYKLVVKKETKHIFNEKKRRVERKKRRNR